ncbi:MAG: aminotransferase class I/II-fold pyridoxal phosphate-dependent enzyme [Peptococcaceae bacterium]|nr:aminotransferase class I/II-fold pyridoxal phosphate-dependent enzyme [Peptococcaceae bacterium]
MQGLILAAGMGKRLGKYTRNRTKCMVEVNGRTLIEYALDALAKAGISRTVIVTGYAGDRLRQFIGTGYRGMEIIYVNNDVYDKTNNIYSLWLAGSHLTADDTILLESDIIFEEKILQDVVRNPEPNLAVVAKFESWMDGTVTILDENDRILSFIPKRKFNWDKAGNYYKTVNIYKFSREFSRDCYMPFLEAYIKAVGRNEYYEQVLRVLTYLDNISIKAHKLAGEKWYEIDDIQDLDIARVLFAEEETELSLYQKRYGGYWRFPGLKDFCYLVNPYFPTEELLSEIKSNFDTLISHYPSGLNVQNLLAAKMFGCDPSEILVGNGASELIRGILKNIDGSIGVIFPTFDEYPGSAGCHRVKKFVPGNRNFSYSVDELKQFSAGLAALVLINPDNPSGHFLARPEVMDLLGYLAGRNVLLILDESFVDFAGEDCRYTMIDSLLLQEYKNLIVVKSISKSYGVPGLRLGVAACGDPELTGKVRRELSIWNINSCGEYFLQIIGKYQADYIRACRRICDERDRFLEKLSEISFLRVIPSRSNYFLCEVVKRFTATELTRILLNKYGIFIKDCTGKTGFENRNYVRIAVRDYYDNNFIVKKLKELETQGAFGL